MEVNIPYMDGTSQTRGAAKHQKVCLFFSLNAASCHVLLINLPSMRVQKNLTSGHRYQADELFHFCILKWMMQSGLPPYQYKSPYLKNFLLVHAKDDPELHCRYLQHNGRWAEACDAYLTLAGKVTLMT